MRATGTVRALHPEKHNGGMGVDRLACGLSLSLPLGLLDERFPKTGPLMRGAFDKPHSKMTLLADMEVAAFNA